MFGNDKLIVQIYILLYHAEAKSSSFQVKYF